MRTICHARVCSSPLLRALEREPPYQCLHLLGMGSESLGGCREGSRLCRSLLHECRSQQCSRQRDAPPR